VYSFPNIILPLIGGLIIDFLGVRVGIFIFTSLLVVGQAVFTYGGYSLSYVMLLIGRSLFGLGGESQNVSQSALVPMWFMGKELAFAMGLNITLARLGSSLNSVMSPWIYEHFGQKLVYPMLAGVGWTIFSLACALLTNWFDYKADQDEGIAEKQVLDESDQVRISDVKTFPLSYWLLLIICLCIYSSFFPFLNVANDLIQVRFGFDREGAGKLLPIVYISSAIICPIFGLIVDQIGRRVQLMCFSYLFLIGAHILMMVPPTAKENYFVVIPLAMLGVFYSMFAAILWPSFALVVHKKYYGSAYGITTAVQNGGLAAVPLAVGWIYDTYSDYRWVNLFLAINAGLGFAFTIWLYVYDNANGYFLHKPSAKQKDAGQAPVEQQAATY
jgi:nitrate/nitrite transporter NarK